MEAITKDTNVIYIGQKPMMNYVLAAGKRLGEGGSSVLIQARGKSISKAVDVALITLDRSKGGVKLDDININTEVLPGSDGNPLNVSSIKISLSKP
ncbi:MAG: DNA-binding protein Alba [Methanomassiliicoccales archaeon]